MLPHHAPGQGQASELPIARILPAILPDIFKKSKVRVNHPSGVRFPGAIVVVIQEITISVAVEDAHEVHIVFIHPVQVACLSGVAWSGSDDPGSVCSDAGLVVIPEEDANGQSGIGALKGEDGD